MAFTQLQTHSAVVFPWPQFPWLLGTFQLLAYLTHITGNGFAKASVAERRDGAPA
jgi:hypothetical protein